MRLGLILPTFADDAAEAIDVAMQAEDLGIDGVFCYDHLWPMGEPGKPALSPYPVLGALAYRTSTLQLGTLVSRIGLVPESVLVSELVTVDALSNGRFIAGVGVGDRKSAAENRAYGVGFSPARERRSSLGRVTRAVMAEGVTTWIGGGSKLTNVIARRHGAVLNLWGAAPSTIKRASLEGPVTWAGRFPKDRSEQATHMAAIAEAGADWAVYIWPDEFPPLLEAARAAGVASFT